MDAWCSNSIKLSAQSAHMFMMADRNATKPELPIADGNGDDREDGRFSCEAHSSVEAIKDSDDEFLEDLLRAPAQRPLVVDDASDDEFLQDLLHAHAGSLPGTLQIARGSGGGSCLTQVARDALVMASTEVARAASAVALTEVARAAPAVASGSTKGDWTPKRHARDIPCHGCPEQMVEEHADMMLHVSMKPSHIDMAIMRIMIRHATSDFRPSALDHTANTLQDAINAVLEKCGICIFKIGITTDPVYRMFNSGYGYAVSGEIFSSMTLLLASFPSVCSYMERALIQRFQARPGCRNTAPGGENAPKSGLCYVYVVYENCGGGKPTRKRKAESTA